MKKIERLYQRILDTCRVIDPTNYNDLSHEVILKIVDNKYILEQEDHKFLGWVFIVGKNIFIEQKRRVSTCREHQPKIIIEQSFYSDYKEPVNYMDKIKTSNLTEIDRLWIDIYLEENGNFKHIASRLNLSRQTVSKHIKQSISKLK